MSPDDSGALRRSVTPLPDGRLVVAEPLVRAFLVSRGLPVPRRVEAVSVEELLAGAGGLAPPFVVKAVSPGILHKSDVGAVVLGVPADELASVAESLRSRLGDAMDGGVLVCEEQVAPGPELLVGLLVRAGIPLVLAGLGGTLTEAVGDVSCRLAPLDAAEALGLVRELRCAALLGTPRLPVTEGELVELLCRLAGAEGVVTHLLGEGLVEFECNPIIVTTDGPVIVDARLVLESQPDATADPAPPRDLGALFAPASIALAGVSTSGRGMGAEALAAYRDAGWNENLVVVHPSATAFDGTPAVASLADAPGGGVDYLKLLLPAPAAVDFLASEGGHARVVQVVSDGFGSPGEPGGLAAGLLAAARTAGVPVVGPNCIGVYSPAGRQTYEPAMPSVAGAVGVVSQSGGMTTDVVRVGAARGLRFSKACSVGNGFDVSPAELLEHLLDDGETACIGLYLEGISDPRRLVRALRRAAGRIPVALLVAGATSAGAAAAGSHTGALATDERVLGALVGSTGAAIARSFDELLALLLGFQAHGGRRPAAGGAGLLVAGHGGGHTAVAGDVCEAAGLKLSALTAPTIAALREHPLGVQKSLVNPVELPIGPIRVPETTRAVLETICATQPFSDVLVHLTARSFYGGLTEGDPVAPLDPVVERFASLGVGLPGDPRIHLVVRSSEAIPASGRDRLVAAASEAGLPLHSRVEDAVVSIRALQAFDRHRSGL